MPSGANAIQAVALGTPLEIGPGWFYVALSVDNTTAAFQRHSPNSNVGMFQAIGMAEAASAFVLPATLAPAAVTAVYLPVCGFFTRSSP